MLVDGEYVINILKYLLSFFRAHGFPNNLETFGLISGLWTSTFALGAFIGPSVAGILYDNIGFRNASMFIFAIHMLVGVMVTAFLICGRRSAAAYSELKEEKIPNGEISSSFMKTPQNSVTESMKRYVFYHFILLLPVSVTKRYRM